MRLTPLRALAFVALAACQSTELPSGGVTGLDGHWEGNAAATLGIESCAKLTPYEMTIRNGDIEGTIRNPTNTSLVATRFYGFVDTDGTLTTRARLMTADLAITGRFTSDSRFFGEVKSPDCTSRLRLDKRRPL